MCVNIIYVPGPNSTPEVARKIVGTLGYFAESFDDKGFSNQDGWGFATETQQFYKTDLPFNVQKIPHNITGNIIMHLRRASDKKLLEPRHSHPYAYAFENDDGTEDITYFQHNGNIKLEKQPNLGKEENPNDYTDSYLAMLSLIQENLDELNPKITKDIIEKWVKNFRAVSTFCFIFLENNQIKVIRNKQKEFYLVESSYGIIGCTSLANLHMLYNMQEFLDVELGFKTSDAKSVPEDKLLTIDRKTQKMEIEDLTLKYSTAQINYLDYKGHGVYDDEDFYTAYIQSSEKRVKKENSVLAEITNRIWSKSPLNNLRKDFVPGMVYKEIGNIQCTKRGVLDIIEVPPTNIDKEEVISKILKKTEEISNQRMQVWNNLIPSPKTLEIFCYMLGGNIDIFNPDKVESDLFIKIVRMSQKANPAEDAFQEEKCLLLCKHSTYDIPPYLIVVPADNKHIEQSVIYNFTFNTEGPQYYQDCLINPKEKRGS